MKLTTVLTKVSRTGEQPGRFIPRCHSEVQLVSCSHFSLARSTTQRSFRPRAKVPCSCQGGCSTKVRSAVPAKLFELLAWMCRPKRCGECFYFVCCALVMWLLPPGKPLFCQSLVTPHARGTRQTGYDNFMFPRPAFASFLPVLTADQATEADESLLRINDKNRGLEDVQRVNQPALPLTYSPPLVDSSSQPSFILVSKQLTKPKDNTKAPRQSHSAPTTEGLGLHPDTEMQEGTDENAVYKWVYRSLPQFARPVQRYSLVQQHVSTPLESTGTLPATMYLRRTQRSDRAGQSRHAGSPWHIFFQLRDSERPTFQSPYTYGRSCSVAGDCRVIGTTAKGARMHHTDLALTLRDAADHASTSSPFISHNARHEKPTLPRHLPYFSVAFLGVGADEDEDEEPDEDEASEKERGHVSGKKTNAEHEEEESDEEDASEKEREVDATEKKEQEEKETEDEVAGKSTEGAKGTKGKADEAAEDKDEGQKKHGEEEDEDKQGEGGTKETAEPESKAEKEEADKTKAQNLPKAHTLIKKKPADYVPAWATPKGGKTVAPEKSPGGTSDALTEKPLILHSALKPKAKIYFREHHKEKTSATHERKAESKDKEKGEKSTFNKTKSEPDNKDKADEKSNSKETEDKHTTTKQTHKEAGEKSEKKGDQSGTPPPIVLQGQPVLPGPSAPGVPGTPVQIQETAQRTLASTPGAVAAVSPAVPVSPAMAPGAANIPSAGIPVSPAVQLPLSPTAVPGTPAGNLAPAGISSLEGTAPAGPVGPLVVGAGPQLLPTTLFPSNPPAVSVLPPSVPMSQGDAAATAAAAAQQAALNSVALQEAQRQQNEIMIAAAQQQKALEAAREQGGSAGGIALTVLLTALLLGCAAGLIYYFYDKITRSVQRMRRKYTEALEERRRKRELRRQKGDTKTEDPDSVTEAPESAAAGREGRAKPHRVRGLRVERSPERR